MVDSAVRGALIRFRIAAWVTGIFLLVLTLVGVPLKEILHHDTVSNVVGQVHGFLLYPAYLIVTFDLARRRNWPYGRMILVMLAGTIPFLSFVAERKVVKLVRGERPADGNAAGSDSAAGAEHSAV